MTKEGRDLLDDYFEGDFEKPEHKKTKIRKERDPNWYSSEPALPPIKNCRKCHYCASFWNTDTEWWCRCTHPTRSEKPFIKCESNLSWFKYTWNDWGPPFSNGHWNLPIYHYWKWIELYPFLRDWALRGENITQKKCGWLDVSRARIEKIVEHA